MSSKVPAKVKEKTIFISPQGPHSPHSYFLLLLDDCEETDQKSTHFLILRLAVIEGLYPTHRLQNTLLF